MMPRELKGALTGAATTFILFVLVPYFLPSYLPQDISQIIAKSGFNMTVFLRQVMFMGTMTAGLTLASGYVSPTSPYALAISMARNMSTFLFMIIFLGAGEIMNLGLTEMTIAVENTFNIIRIDLQFFIWVTLGTVMLRIFGSIIEWREGRIELAPKIPMPKDDFHFTKPLHDYEPQNSSKLDPQDASVPQTGWELAQEETQTVD
jgi:hypothetical protein